MGYWLGAVIEANLLLTCKAMHMTCPVKLDCHERLLGYFIWLAHKEPYKYRELYEGNYSLWGQLLLEMHVDADSGGPVAPARGGPTSQQSQQRLRDVQLELCLRLVCSAPSVVACLRASELLFAYPGFLLAPFPSVAVCPPSRHTMHFQGRLLGPHVRACPHLFSSPRTSLFSLLSFAGPT